MDNMEMEVTERKIVGTGDSKVFLVYILIVIAYINKCQKLGDIAKLPILMHL